MKKKLTMLVCLVLVCAMLATPALAWTITFEPNGGKGTMYDDNTYVVDGDTEFVIPDCGFTKTNWVFDHWEMYDYAVGPDTLMVSNLKPDDTYLIDRDVVLKAIWKWDGPIPEFDTPVTPSEPDVPTRTPGPRSFLDVHPGDWFYDAVTWASAQGLMVGYGNGYFGPNDYLTRAMVIQVLNNMVGGKATKLVTQFSDVKTTDWYAPSVSWAVENKIVKGVTDTFFGADNTSSRIQTIVMFYNCAILKGLDLKPYDSLAGFTDLGGLDAGELDALHWAVGAGLIQGKGAGRIAPDDLTTRAELATMLMRYLTKLQ